MINNIQKGQHADEYNIHINFGVTELERNPELLALYEKFIVDKNPQQSKEGKLMLIINHTNEKFTFKWFNNDKQIKDYFNDLDNSDHFEDVSFSVRLP